MPLQPLELTVELQPQQRFDALDIRARAAALHGDVLEQYPRCLYNSFHTTAGFLDQSLAWRLSQRRQGLTGYMDAFRAVFPPGAGYRHDELELRRDLSAAQRKVEPKNADSHLAFMAAGLRTCVIYVNRPNEAVPFVDLDGVNDGRPRLRQAGIVGYSSEEEVCRTHIEVPVSGHPIDSINLRAPGLGLYEQVAELIARHGVTKGRIRLELGAGERQAGLTVNEYETLLMRHDLREVLRNPLRFMAIQGRNALRDPLAIPTKTLGYAKFDLVRTLNQFVDAVGLNESFIERLLARAMALPAERFLRMKRSVNLFVSDRGSPGQGTIVEGTYQSPILVQWRQAPRRVRHIELSLVRFI